MKTRKKNDKIEKHALEVDRQATPVPAASAERIVAAFFAALALFQFFYFRLFIRTELYFTAQEPVFYLERYFFRSFLRYPAGLLNYLSAFIGHLGYVPWLGAGALALINTGVVLLFFVYLKRLIGASPPVLSALPLIPLMLMHNNYFHAATINLVLLVALSLACLYVMFERDAGRALFFVFAAVAFYFAAGATVFVFAVMAILFEWVKKRNTLLPVIYLLVVLLLPLISGRLFAVASSEVWRNPLESQNEAAPKPWAVLIVWALTLLLAVIGGKFWQRRFWLRADSTAVQAALMLLIIFVVPLLKLNRDNRQFWLFNYHARMEQWPEVLQLCEKPYLKNTQVMIQINRALCHIGRLADRMFYYFQPFGREGLFVFDDYAVSTTLIRSDIYFDLGHYNAAKQWAHEAVSVRGETVWNMQRLALTYLISGQRPAAEIYFTKLEHSLFHRAWAKRYRPFWQGKAELRSDADLAPLVDNLVDRDFITFINHPEQDLPHLLAKNPRNRFAFDYLAADLLLSKKLKRFVAELRERRLLTGRLPRHYQEALIFYISQTNDDEKELEAFLPDRRIVDDFRRFQTLVRQHRNNLPSAKSFFEEFRQTYWYYLLFHQTEKGA